MKLLAVAIALLLRCSLAAASAQSQLQWQANQVKAQALQQVRLILCAGMNVCREHEMAPSHVNPPVAPLPRLAPLQALQRQQQQLRLQQQQQQAQQARRSPGQHLPAETAESSPLPFALTLRPLQAAISSQHSQQQAQVRPLCVHPA